MFSVFRIQENMKVSSFSGFFSFQDSGKSEGQLFSVFFQVFFRNARQLKSGFFQLFFSGIGKVLMSGFFQEFN